VQQITAILRGDIDGHSVPDVLRSPKLMKPADVDGLNLRAAFEGFHALLAATDAPARDKDLPKNLCLSQCHTTSKKNRFPKVFFDIDSICCFPTSLAVARFGINWFAKPYAHINLTADIHFGLRVLAYNNNGVLTTTYMRFDKIPYYCIGRVNGIESFSMFIFFLQLYLESDYKRDITIFSKRDYEVLYDGIIGPALNKILDSLNPMQHYSASARIIQLDATALSKKSYARKESAREQHLQYFISHRYLDSLWTLILETINTYSGYERFKGATLFLTAKNTKLSFMDTMGDPNAAYESWQS